MPETVTIYITKDAATKGIREAQAARASHVSGYVYVPQDTPNCGYYSPASCHTDLPAAIADAERRRDKRIAALEKQLAAVRAIDLTKPAGGSDA